MLIILGIKVPELATYTRANNIVIVYPQSCS